MNITLSNTEPVPSEPINILVVDDVPENLVAMRALLQAEGVEVLCAASGAQALELLLVHEVAVALLDVQMPEMDGFSLAELMRGAARSREVPIIFLTASPSDPKRAFKGYEAGAVDFLHKPIEPHVILSKTNVFVQLFQQRQLLKERAESLEIALKLNETMMAVLTHDLRTPLSAMLLCAEKLAMQLPGDERVQRTLSQLETSGWRMARMVEQLLDFSRIRSGGFRIEPRTIDLTQVLQGAIDEVKRVHTHADIEYEAEQPLEVKADPDRLTQVIINLVGNAVIHGKEGPVRIVVETSTQSPIVLRVSNQGHINEELLPRLFEPFKGAFHASQGLGLGLFIADQFVRAHGGTLSATNDNGEVHLVARFERLREPTAS